MHYQKLSSTRACAAWSRADVRRRGVAEIEAIFCAVVLALLMLMGIGALKIAGTRMTTQNAAIYDSFKDSTNRPSPTLEGDSLLTPIDGTTTVRPGLPNRTHVSRQETHLNVNVDAGQTIPAVIQALAGTIGPQLSYGAYPNLDDREDGEKNVKDWFNAYVEESHSEVIDPLGLAPAWSP